MALPDTQNLIISKLKTADSLRYRDLKPEDMANDLFNYHLKSLVTKGIVDKVTGGYTLSKTGKAHVADVHHLGDSQLNRLFKLGVITIVSRVNNGTLEILSQYRTAQPSYGITGVMGGTIVKGEDIVVGAARRLKDKTGLTASFKLLGIERRRLYVAGELFSDFIFPICYADNFSGELISTKFGENFWVPIDQAIENEKRPFDNIPSIITCLEAIRDNKLDSLTMFYNETTQEDNK